MASLDYLKIDGSFIKDIDEDPISLAMVRAVNHIALLMGMQTIAQHVESEARARVLRGIGIDCRQGYAYGRPVVFMPVDEVPDDPFSVDTVEFMVGAA